MKLLGFRRKRTEITDQTADYSTGIPILIDQISKNPHQPRKNIDEVGIVTLADSIRIHGLLQPISIRPRDDEDDVDTEYVLIAGERRYLAMKMLGYKEIPCQILDISPREAAELAIIENIMRQDISLFELAEAYHTLLTDFNLTQEELAKRLSTSQSNIANKLRLLYYRPNERNIIEEYALTERHARAILRIKDEKLRFKTLLFVGEHKLTVKDTEEYVDKLLLPKDKRKPDKNRLSFTEALALMQSIIKKPLSKLEKRGIQASTEEITDDFCHRIIISIPLDRETETE